MGWLGMVQTKVTLYGFQGSTGEGTRSRDDNRALPRFLVLYLLLTKLVVDLYLNPALSTKESVNIRLAM